MIVVNAAILIFIGEELMRIKTLSKWLAVGGITLGSLAIQQVYASSFQLYEQDAASLGDAHAGIVASDSDSAADNFYNPAALTRLKSQQITTGAVAFDTSMRYTGTVRVVELNGVINDQQNAAANGGIFTLVPNFHYALPINEQWVLGFSIATPFGLKTDYGQDTALKYAATQTSLRTVDLTPGFGYKVNNWFSVGAGVDAVYLNGVFNQVAGMGFPLLDPANDTQSKNSGHDWGFGYHAGMLFELTQNDRIGLAYHSQVVNHLHGASTFEGALAGPAGVHESRNLKANVTLPPYTALSYFHAFNSQWAAMGTVQYTQWNVLQNLSLQNVAMVDQNLTPTTGTVNVSEHYHNAWNFALGMHYSPIEKVTLKFGADYDQTPSHGVYRNVQLPDQNRIMLNIGVHWQFIKKMGVDFGYSHIFFKTADINNTQIVGPETVITQGHSRNFANLYGMQFTWNF